MSKALNIMQKSKSVEDRAVDYLESIKRNIQADTIDVLLKKRDKIKDKISGVLDFTLQTDLNAGQSSITRDDCESRFKRAMEYEYELEILNLEIEAKEAIFAKYFDDVKSV